jgi:GDPmannose 4,6-dehydratase
MKKALITGITGQDGSYLSRFLLQKGYRVYGLIRKGNPSSVSHLRYLQIEKKVQLLKTDYFKKEQIDAIMKRIKPDEIYHLAAMSSVAQSFREPLKTMEFNLLSTSHLLQAALRFAPKVRFYQASSSEMFGSSSKQPLTEQSPFQPVSPYGISKVSSHWLAHSYRRMHNLYCACGILFNHESVLRPKHFAVKKIISSAVRIKKGSKEKLTLGNTHVKRDWGYAPEYVKAMWLMLQQKQGEDFILATNEAHSLDEFVRLTFAYLGLDVKKHVQVDKTLFRQNDIPISIGSPKKIKSKLKWTYNLRFADLVKLLVDEEMQYQRFFKHV